VPVTSYFPYSGKTPSKGITAKLQYGGTLPGVDWSMINAKGKIVHFDVPLSPMPLGKWYKVWEIYDNKGDHDFPASESRTPYIAALPSSLLADAKKAGAVGVTLGWRNISDGNARYQYAPFSQKYEGVPAVWVGRSATDRLGELSGDNDVANITLEADITTSSTDTLLATLAGTRSDEIIIVNTHTDGPNAFQENGGIGLLACAKYFSQISQGDRNRTILFVLATGHFAEPYVSSSQWMKDRPELVQKAVASLSMEHLGATEWVDDPSTLFYHPTGKTEMNFAFCPSKVMADILSDSLKGTAAGRIALVDPETNHMLSMGNAVYHAGIPTISYISFMNYMQAIPPNGYIDKLNPTRMHEEILAFAGAIEQLDKAKGEDLRANTPAKAGSVVDLGQGR
jgi:hypothetical protein